MSHSGHVLVTRGCIPRSLEAHAVETGGAGIEPAYVSSASAQPMIGLKRFV